ncbi:sensor histidine kinase [Allorhodopirellula solitaria]|uniref:histidine kinase n=1 Tax=Allorhodopirellula solitaria TaxID=2527987 RepID=A0A5C5Y0D9_9BACT|nr:HAMP domain-containing sensor histidine kinase [Allorhodopirellula solitaria]TWT67112.1 Sporulation kinase D [Allorhodopirellula solitaria]
MPAATRYAGWLPPIVDRGRAGWLPFQSTSVAAISGVLARERSSSTRIRDSLRRALLGDPALLLHSIAVMSSSKSTLDEYTPLSCLIDWWCQYGRSAWRETDWLAAPSGSDAAALLARYTKLDDYFHLLPRRRWLEEADVWFSAAGIGNPIGQSWELDWPEQDAALSATEPFADAHLTIAASLRDQGDRDLTSEAFDEAVQASKRELAHTLAYGLSHEINNPLANISTRAQALQSRVPTELTGSVQRIVDQTSRAHAMIADLMFYANPPGIVPSEFDLQARIQLAVDSLTETAERLGIEIGMSDAFLEQPLKVSADAEMVGEAVAALIRNSIEAIGTDGHIRIDVTTEQSTVLISIADSGPGISAEAAKMAASPYYSGREAGRGLGLGLCRVDRIAALHGGSLKLAPALAGCVATIELPIACV